MDIPGLDPFILANHPNPSQFNFIRLRYCVLLVGFGTDAGALVSPDDMAALVADFKTQLEVMNRFYSENSYGSFELELRIRSFRAAHPRDWVGTHPGLQNLTPGVPVDPATLPTREEFDGYGHPVVPLIGGGSRDYKARYGFANMCQDAFDALATTPRPSYDDEGAFEEWIRFGSKPDQNSILFLVSPDFVSAANPSGTPPGSYRDFPAHLPTAAGRTFKAVVASHVGSTHTGSTSLLIHEASHSLGSSRKFLDRYNSFSKIGVLGHASMLALQTDFPHFDGPLKHRLGWVTPRSVAPSRGVNDINLKPIYRGPTHALMIRPDVLGRPEEYVFVEVRDGSSPSATSATGQPIEFDQNLSNRGLAGVLAYHVDTSDTASSEQPRVDLLGELPDVHGDLIPGSFGAKGANTFLIYDSEQGVASFFELTPKNVVHRIGALHVNWRKGWDIIVSGDFGGGGPTDDLLFYDRSGGKISLFSTDGAGNVTELKVAAPRWGRTLTHIVVGDFGSGPRRDLLLYDAPRGHGQLWSTGPDGALTSIGPLMKDWPKTWTQIIVGDFSSSKQSDVVFYEGSTGKADFYQSGGGKISKLGPGGQSLGSDAKHITAVRPLGPAPLDGLFVLKGDRYQVWSCDGAGEVAKMTTPSDSFGHEWTDAHAVGANGQQLLIHSRSKARVLTRKIGSDGIRTGGGEATEQRALQPGDTVRPHETRLHAGRRYTGLNLGIRKGDNGSFNLDVRWDYQGGHADIYRLGADYRFTSVAHKKGWRTGCRVVPGRFDAGTVGDVLLYGQTDGHGEFLSLDPQGSHRRLGVHGNWRKSWSKIVPGQFGGDGQTDLLFYDAAAGEGHFYRTQNGQMVALRSLTGWRKSWTHIVPGNFAGDGHTDLLFYEGGAGEGHFMRMARNGSMSTLGHPHRGWRTNWHTIVAGDFKGPTSRSDLLFYDRSTGTGAFYATDGNGGLFDLKLHTNWRHTWDKIVPFQPTFGGPHLMFYDGTNGVLAIYEMVGPGVMAHRATFEGVSHRWDDVLPLHLSAKTQEFMMYSG